MKFETLSGLPIMPPGLGLQCVVWLSLHRPSTESIHQDQKRLHVRRQRGHRSQSGEGRHGGHSTRVRGHLWTEQTVS